MMICPRCGKELADGTRFCDGCGTQICETVFCPRCGEQNSADFSFCQRCGAALQGEPEKKKSGLPFRDLLRNRAVVFGGIGVIAVVAVVLIVSLIAGGFGGGGNNYAFYIKNGEINYTDFSKNGPMEISSRLGGGYGDSAMSGLANSIGPYVVLCSDGRTMFYPDRYDGGSFSLYYRNIAKTGEEPTRVDTGITAYYVTDKGDRVFYVKEGALYQHDLKERTRITSEVCNFAVSSDGKTVLYRDEDGGLYLWSGADAKDKIAGGVDSISKYSGDLSVIYYMKDGSLYKFGKDGSEKIASDVFRLVRIYDSGEAYYIKSVDEEIRLMDYVDDDKAAFDAGMEYPVSPTRPSAPRVYSSYYYSSREEYDEAVKKYGEEMDAYTKAYEQYQEDIAEYREKQDRDSIRSSLEYMAISRTAYTLYYYDGSDSAEVSDSLVSAYDVTSSTESAVLAVSVYERSEEMGKTRLSEITSPYELQNEVYAALYSDSRYVIVAGSGVTSFDQNEIYGFVIANDGSSVMFLDDVSGDYSKADLYQISFKDGEVEKPALYDTDVSTSCYGVLSNGSLYYFKDVRNNKGDLYIDRASVDYDVFCYRLDYYEDTGTLYYLIDYSPERGNGTLKMYKGGSSTRIADDVSDFVIVNGDNIFYLYDFSTRYYTGSVYLYKGREAEKIDDDVSGIIHIYSAEARRSFFAR